MEFEPAPEAAGEPATEVPAEPAPEEATIAPLLWTGADVWLACAYSIGFLVIAMVVVVVVVVLRALPGSSWRYLDDMVAGLVVVGASGAAFLAATAAVLHSKRYRLSDAGFGAVNRRELMVWLGWAVAATVVVALIGGGLIKLGLHTNRSWRSFAPGGFSWPGMIVMTLMVGFAAPFYEEFFFRGMLFRWLRDTRGFWLAAVVSSALFGAIHFDLPVGLAMFVLGMLSAWAYQRTESLWPCFLIHAVNNTVRIVGLYVLLALGIPMD